MENEDCEEAARLLEEVMKESIELGVGEVRKCPRSKRWFDEEVKSKRKEMTRKRRWGRKGLEESEIKLQRVKEWKKKKTEYFRLVREKKKECWDKFIQDTEEGKLWDVWRVATQKKYAKTPALESAEGIRVTFEEKETTFLKYLFPKAPPDPPRIENARGGRERIRITETQAQEAISRQGSFKAPGPDEIGFKAIKELWEILGERITETYQMCLDVGYHPKRWRKAIGAIIPKPNKADYTKSKAYRPISLLNTLGKGLERIVTDYLAEFGEKGGLEINQWGGRKNRSAEECVGYTLDWAEKKREEGAKVVMVAMDVSQAFPNVSKVRLENTLKQEGANGRVVEWVTSFMSKRKIALRFDNEKGEEKDIETGILQGSPASPILFNLFIAPLIKEVNRCIEEEFEGKAITPTYIDDFTIVAAGKDWEQAMARAERIIEKAYEWAEENCVKFDEEKTDWIRLHVDAREEQEVMRMPNGTEKEELKVLKWLGIWIDQKCTFEMHVREKTARAARAAQNVMRLSRGSQGIGVGNGRKMYIACSRQIAEYGGRVWWKGQKGLATEIDKVNINAMRRIGGHYRTAPTAAIEVENDMIPTAHRLEHKTRMMGVNALKRDPRHPMQKAAKEEIRRRMERKDEWNTRRKEGKGKGRKRGMTGAIEGLGKLIGEKGKWEKIENWKKLYKEEEGWEKRVREEIQIEIRKYGKEEKERQIARKEGRDEVVIYSDGSRTQEGETAAGICRLGKGGEVIKRVGYRLGRQMEIMDAEMVAMKKAIEVGMKEANRERKRIITVIGDSQEALRRVGVRKARPGEEMAYKIRWLCDAARTQKMEVRLEWVKAHEGVKGNEEADKMAKAAIGKGGVDKDAFISFAFLQQESKSMVIEEWDREWKLRRNEKRALSSPYQRHEIRFKDTDRTNRVLISRLRTGHIQCNEYMHTIGKRESAACECGAEKQNVEHILTACSRTKTSREGKKECDTIKKLLWTKEGIEKAIEIWKQWRRLKTEEGEEEEGERERERELRQGWGDLEE